MKIYIYNTNLIKLKRSSSNYNLIQTKLNKHDLLIKERLKRSVPTLGNKTLCLRSLSCYCFGAINHTRRDWGVGSSTILFHIW